MTAQVKWSRFENDSCIPRFIDAAFLLHADLLAEMEPWERPHFADLWLQKFNTYQCWLATDGDQAVSLVTVPRNADVHSFRWYNRTLTVHPQWIGQLSLPDDVDIKRSFQVPIGGEDPPSQAVLKGLSHKPVQLVYVQRIDKCATDNRSPQHCVRLATIKDLDELTELLSRVSTERTSNAPSLQPQIEELRHIIEHNAGWCLLAQENDIIVGLATYVALAVPIMGVPGALVADLAVDPEHRRRGIALSIQQSAMSMLLEHNINWLWGNIDPDNIASRRQALSHGRRVWIQVLRFSCSE